MIHVGAADSARAAADWLRQHGVDPPESPHRPPNGATPAKYPDRPESPPSAPRRALAASEAIPGGLRQAAHRDATRASRYGGTNVQLPQT